ncbi:response regulator [Candidatus Kaiserbacteria bacterium]|nr:response regulator [Candidatus Kaiserbacteria bacterium]
MSNFAHKQIVVAGGEDAQILKLGATLDAKGADILKETCEAVTAEWVNEHKIDLILLNHVRGDDACLEMLDRLKGAQLDRAVPIFVHMDKPNDDDIHDVLARGATDYITAEEGIDSMMQKITTVIGDGFIGSVAIDITPPEADVTATGVRVFVIEDDPLLRNLLAIRMSKSKFPCEFSSDGDKVIPVMRQFKPDVVILDLMLPGKSGFEVLKEMKDDRDLKNVPVIVFSNRDAQEDKQRAAELGAGKFYVKAMTDLSELVETIESLVK